jgi:heat shock protein HslJ
MSPSRKYIILTILALSLLAFSACIQPTESAPSGEDAAAPPAGEEVTPGSGEFLGTGWELLYMGTPEDNRPVLDGTRPTLFILLGNYAGNGGCNFYIGGYTAGQLGLQLNQPAVTLRQCDQPEGVMDQESSFIGALANTTETRTDGENLVLYTVGEQPLLTFAPLEAEAASPDGTAWSLAFMIAGDEALPVLEETEITAQFADGQISGSAGCNDYNGSATIEGDSLTIGPLMSTQKMCADREGVDDQESDYLSALASVASYQQLDDMLLLLDENGDPLLVFGLSE